MFCGNVYRILPDVDKYIRHNTAEEELNKLHVFGRGSEVQRKFVDIIHEDTFYTYLAFSIVVGIRETRSGGI